MQQHAHCSSASRVRESDQREHELQSCLAEAGGRRSVPAGQGGGGSIRNGLRWREVCNGSSKETEHVAIVRKAVGLARNRGCDVDMAPFRGTGKACKCTDMSALPCSSRLGSVNADADADADAKWKLIITCSYSTRSTLHTSLYQSFSQTERVEEADTAADGMGICASCLGLNRHPSHDREIDRLLNSEQPNAAYGAVDHATFAQPDEEELRREREALEHITAHAAVHMIDVLHPSQSDLHCAQVLGGNRSYRTDPTEHSAGYQESQHSRAQPETEDFEEVAWLESVQSAQLDTIQMPKSGTLTMDIGLLRESRPSQRNPKHESAH
ncbi:hypothetical protein AC579_1806 [Pseudocercospora musae]|uniref:Uncharacterized protein n=1 Tax=Pseudocercospora musae TaxID=113226 RepID=A0A139IDE8_9PEZI|nr:hypothetical protein AC579_1806 [Pseudocercospora musae]KXT12784.1 hypothetical protein AC579_1806 [Pseudocercospora musae]KXT12786.1 hypothetical protein AC579_1806 [Pseudocercospora musae]